MPIHLMLIAAPASMCTGIAVGLMLQGGNASDIGAVVGVANWLWSCLYIAVNEEKK